VGLAVDEDAAWRQEVEWPEAAVGSDEDPLLFEGVMAEFRHPHTP
jgi:hypothetical protein